MVTTPPMRARRGEVADESIDESRIAAIGGMREARIAGKTAATTVTSRPATNDQMTALAGMTIELAGMSSPSAPSNALSPMARKIPPTKPTIDATMPTSDGLEQHRTDHLALPRADGPQQGELAAALGHDDRERVEDDEGADEQRDDAEDEQERVEERQVVLHVVLALLGDRPCR